MRFSDRVQAGRQLADLLKKQGIAKDTVVLGLPRGGVPVAYEVAVALDLPLDVIIVRKLGVPFQRELAMGAIGEDEVRVLNDEVVRGAGVGPEDIATVEKLERAELERRVELFRGDRPRIPLTGRTALIIDDGIATGSTVRAACQVARAHGASRVVVATPVAPSDTVSRLQSDADDVLCVSTPTPFWAIGEFYRDFTQTRDEEVARLLADAAARPQLTSDTSDEEVEVTLGQTHLAGHLSLPVAAPGVVLFAHGSGSGRHSPRNRYVAAELNKAGLGTLLFDLLTSEEEADRANVFDIPMLGTRLAQVTKWLRSYLDAPQLSVGYFGASTGAGAALWAATEPGAAISAIVSRGGRPDLALVRLPAVKAPTLLIVGGRDDVVIELNEEAQQHLKCESRLAIVPGATHLFEEPGALDAVVALARDWFLERVGRTPPARRRADPVERDPYLEHAREEAEGVDVFTDPAHGGFLERAREEAQGVEVFSDPDATLPAGALREGSPGEETFTGDNLELGPEGEEERDR
jgi:putative phosphoribosyl transferase